MLKAWSRRCCFVDGWGFWLCVLGGGAWLVCVLKNCPCHRDLIYGMISFKPDSLYAQDCTTRIGFFHSPPSTSVPTTAGTVTAVQRHCLCSAFSIRSSPVEQGPADREENHQFLDLKLHHFISIHIQSSPPSSLSAPTFAHLLCCHPALPDLQTLSLLSLQPTKARRMPNLPSTGTNSSSYHPYRK